MKLALGRALYDPGDPMGRMFFNILATFAEFEADLIRMRTRGGMAIARAKGKLRGKQPKLSDRQQRELCRMHATGEYSISDHAELFSISRSIVYLTLNRRHSPKRTILPLPESTPSWADTAGRWWFGDCPKSGDQLLCRGLGEALGQGSQVTSCEFT